MPNQQTRTEQKKQEPSHNTPMEKHCKETGDHKLLESFHNIFGGKPNAS